MTNLKFMFKVNITTERKKTPFLLKIQSSIAYSLGYPVKAWKEEMQNIHRLTVASSSPEADNRDSKL